MSWELVAQERDAHQKLFVRNRSRSESTNEPEIHLLGKIIDEVRRRSPVDVIRRNCGHQGRMEPTDKVSLCARVFESVRRLAQEKEKKTKFRQLYRRYCD